MSKCYVITFEVGTESARLKLRDRLKGYGTHCPIHKNCWAIMTEQSAPQIREYLSQALSPQDRLFIVRSGTEAAWRNSYGDKNNAWLKKNL